ncbi:hypothetical protein HYS93_05070 [Candidatus Daviesbacteria bacterium]|nr:hypothetical protein [Candidatus Daviesbacteria bacterium]
MNLLETALVVLVTVWTIVFIIIAIAVLLVFFSIKKGLDKANKILDETEDIAKRIDLPSKVVIASILAFMAKNSINTVKEFVSNFIPGRKKK